MTPDIIFAVSGAVFYLASLVLAFGIGKVLGRAELNHQRLRSMVRDVTEGRQ
jgi:UDP:flavonoid glycosyltransferase YjiC (YdhE family)